VAPIAGRQALLVAGFSRVDTTGPSLSILDLPSNALRRVGTGGLTAHYGGGHVVYSTFDLVLYRRPFDLDQEAFTGPAEVIARDIRWDAVPAVAVSGMGDVVYGVGLPQAMASARLALTDRAGREQQVLVARAPWAPRFSPDGRRLAYGARAPGHGASDVWVTDLAAGTTRRVSTDGRDNNDPSWSPDGRSLAHSTYTQAMQKQLAVRPVDGGPPRILAPDEKGFDAWPSDWSRDGAVLFTRVGLGQAFDVWMQPTAGGAPRPYLTGPFREFGARVSRDGRWAAYTSNESGRDEVYVESFPTPGRKTLVSAGGGVSPVWRGDGRELYYWREDELVAVAIAEEPGGALVVGGRSTLFRAPYLEGVHANYDVSPDGTRFAVVSGRRWSNRMIVVLRAAGRR
jgi:serine/threonine-protein kinase